MEVGKTMYNALWRMKNHISDHTVATVTGVAAVGALCAYAIGYLIRAVKK